MHQRLAQTFDSHRTSRGEVQKASFKLSRTVGGDTARDHLTLRPRNLSTTDGALRGHPKALLFSGSLRLDYFEHLGDDIATLFNKHPITDADAKTLDLVRVVQSCPRDGCTRKAYRLQVRHRRQ